MNCIQKIYFCKEKWKIPAFYLKNRNYPQKYLKKFFKNYLIPLRSARSSSRSFSEIESHFFTIVLSMAAKNSSYNAWVSALRAAESCWPIFWTEASSSIIWETALICPLIRLRRWMIFFLISASLIFIKYWVTKYYYKYMYEFIFFKIFFRKNIAFS